MEASFEKAKRDKFLSPCAKVGLEFQPLALETLGGIGPSAAALIKEIHDLIAARSPSFKPRSSYQSLSVALQRTNASAILSRTKP